MSSSEFLAVVRLAVKGAQSAKKDIETFRKSIMETGKAAGLSKKEMDQLDKTISKGSASQRQAAQASKQTSESKKRESAQSKKLREELERLNNQYKRTQQQLAGRGGDPSAAIGRFSQEELKRIVALNQVYPKYGKEVAKAAREALRLAEAKQKVNQSMSQAQNSTKTMGSSLPRLRYALYDVSQTAALLGAALAGIGRAVIKTAVEYERSFAEVIRTTGVTGAEVDKLREQFENLNTELPVSFQELAKVGKLAGQLGIPTADIENFTRLVVQFSETTGIGVEEAATAFGRLSALLGLTGDQFDNLGSSILKAGTSFVATEADIIAISTQLAGVGRQAGLTADQVVGLSTALASVGIAPELARGVITRTFGRIGQAVVANGSRLNDFAKIAGMTSDEFATAWRDDAAGAFVAFTRGIAARGGEAEAALRALGITSIRDVPALLRLSQTAETILAPALQVASEGFEEGTELADQYGIIAGTTAEQMNRLKQNVQQLFAEMAKGVLVFSPAIESISSVVKVLREITKIPIVGFLSSMATATVTIAGLFLLALGGAIRFAASLLAVRTSLKELNAISEGQRVTLRNLVVEAFRASTGNQKLAVSNMKVASSANASTTAVNASTAALFRKNNITAQVAMQNMNLAATSGAATKAVRAKTAALSAMGSVMRTIPWMLAIAAVLEIGNEFERAKLRGEELVKTLSDIEDSSDGAAKAIGVLSESVGVGITGKFRELDAALKGVNAEIYVLEQLAPRIAWLFMDRQQPLLGIDPYQTSREFRELAEALGELIEKGNLLQAGETFQGVVKAMEEAGVETEFFIKKMLELNPELAIFADESDRGAAAVLRLREQQTDGADAALAHAESLSILRDEMMELVDDAYSVVNAERAMEEALDKLGAAFAENGAEVEANGKIIQDVVKLIIDQAQGDVPTAVANIQALYDTLISEGIAYAEQLTIIKQIQEDLLASVGAGDMRINSAGLRGARSNIPAPTINTEALTDAYEQVSVAAANAERSTRGTARNTRAAADAARDQANAVEEVEEKVRTLLDYSRDLTTVFNRAFSIRFDAQSQLDAIANTWDNIAESVQEAEERIRELTATQAQLGADRSIKEYFLSVAEAYGDTLRADVLRGEIAEIELNIASNAEEIASAQADSSRELEGNSQAARGNRAALTGLVSQYQGYIGALAASGASQDELAEATANAREEFVEQATALGFAEEDIKTYAAAFDDVTTAIDNVPRDVTIEADVNPAITALKELEAQQKRNIDSARELNNTISQTPAVRTGGGGGGVVSGLSSAERSQLQKDLKKVNEQLSAHSSDRRLYNQAGRMADWERIRNDLIRQRDTIEKRLSRGYAQGGFTGRGAKYEPAGVVHKGEYVVPKQHVNQNTGLPDFSFLTSMRNGMFNPVSYAPSEAMGTIMVELSPTDRELLRASGSSGDIIVAVDSREIARAANTGNKTLASGGFRP